MKAPKRLRQWRNKFHRRDEKKDARVSRETRQNFIRHHTNKDVDSPTRTPARFRKTRNRAKAKRSKTTRKRNR